MNEQYLVYPPDFDHLEDEPDYYDWQWEWESFCECLGEWLNRKFPDEYNWIALGSGMGWMKQSGYTTIHNTHGSEANIILEKIAPKTDYHVRVTESDSAIRFNFSHHDCPTGGHVVEIQPLKFVIKDLRTQKFVTGRRCKNKPVEANWSTQRSIAVWDYGEDADLDAEEEFRFIDGYEVLYYINGDGYKTPVEAL